MSEQELTAKMDAALAHVDPDRRKFLGILLAGVAAAPLLASASLAAAADKPPDPKAHKGDTAIKDGSANTIKMNDQKTQNIKFWDKTGSKSNAQIKGETHAIKGENSTVKLNNGGAIKNNADTIKLTNAGGIKGNNTIKLNNGGAIKASTGTGQEIKISSSTIKNNSAIKGENTAIKG
jgi:hypothetical protein